MLKQAALVMMAAGFLTQPAMSQANASVAYTTNGLNMRAGPGTSYPVITTLPQGAAVQISGCTAGYGWCDASYGNMSGWVSGSYLVYGTRGSYYRQPIPSAGVYIGVPIINRNVTIYNRPVRPRVYAPPPRGSRGPYYQPRPPRAVAPILPDRPPRAQVRPPRPHQPMQPPRGPRRS